MLAMLPPGRRGRGREGREGRRRRGGASRRGGRRGDGREEGNARGKRREGEGRRGSGWGGDNSYPCFFVLVSFFSSPSFLLFIAPSSPTDERARRGFRNDPSPGAWLRGGGGGGGERGLPGVGAARAASRCPARPMMSAAASPLGPASGLSASLGPPECHPVARGAAEDSRDPRDISDAEKDASSCVIFLPIFPSVCLPRVSMAARRCRNRRWRDE